MIVRCLIVIALVLFAVVPRLSKAENSSDKHKACTGLLYKSKKDNVAVYQEPDLTAQVLTRLSIGEEVCSIGEEKGFAIIDWQVKGKKAEIANKESEELGEAAAEKNKLVFVRLVDLWQKTNTSSGPLGRIVQYVKYILYGGVPEDPLLPYRPVLDPFAAGENQSSSSKGK